MGIFKEGEVYRDMPVQPKVEATKGQSEQEECRVLKQALSNNLLSLEDNPGKAGDILDLLKKMVPLLQEHEMDEAVKKIQQLTSQEDVPMSTLIQCARDVEQHLHYITDTFASDERNHVSRRVGPTGNA